MGVGAMGMTSTALGGGKTNEKEYVPQTPVSSGVVGRRGIKDLT